MPTDWAVRLLNLQMEVPEVNIVLTLSPVGVQDSTPWIL